MRSCWPAGRRAGCGWDLTGIRMEKAKQLLLATALPIAEISAQSGYGDYRVFTKVFKKSEGVTPSQYRRGFLENGT